MFSALPPGGDGAGRPANVRGGGRAENHGRSQGRGEGRSPPKEPPRATVRRQTDVRAVFRQIARRNSYISPRPPGGRVGAESAGKAGARSRVPHEATERGPYSRRLRARGPERRMRSERGVQSGAART